MVGEVAHGSAFTSASSSREIASEPFGASLMAAFMPLRWSAATMSMCPSGVLIDWSARRSSVVSSFMISLLWGLFARPIGTGAAGGKSGGDG